MRVASVAPTEADWLDLDADCWPLPIQESEIIDWPHPEPGPGMVAVDGVGFMWPAPMRPAVPNDDLTESDLPGPEDDWSRIEWFAASFTGYEEWGSRENLSPLANVVREYFERVGELPQLGLRALSWLPVRRAQASPPLRAHARHRRRELRPRAR